MIFVCNLDVFDVKIDKSDVKQPPNPFESNYNVLSESIKNANILHVRGQICRNDAKYDNLGHFGVFWGPKSTKRSLIGQIPVTTSQNAHLQGPCSIYIPCSINRLIDRIILATMGRRIFRGGRVLFIIFTVFLWRGTNIFTIFIEYGTNIFVTCDPNKLFLQKVQKKNSKLQYKHVLATLKALYTFSFRGGVPIYPLKIQGVTIFSTKNQGYKLFTIRKKIP